MDVDRVINMSYPAYSHNFKSQKNIEISKMDFYMKIVIVEICLDFFFLKVKSLFLPEPHNVEKL